MTTIIEQIKLKHSQIEELRKSIPVQPLIHSPQFGCAFTVDDSISIFKQSLKELDLPISKEQEELFEKMKQKEISAYEKIKEDEKQLETLVSELKSLVKESSNEDKSLIDISSLYYVSVRLKHFSDKSRLDMFKKCLSKLDLKFIQTNSRICFEFKEERKDCGKKLDVRDLLKKELQKEAGSLYYTTSEFYGLKDIAQRSKFDLSKSELLEIL